MSFLLQTKGQVKRSWYTHIVTHLNRDMAQFNLCFRVAFLAVLLPLASGEHHIILNLLERFIFILQSTFRVLGWRFLSVMSAVALGFLSRSPWILNADSIVFFLINVILKRMAQLKIYLLLHQAQFGSMENYTKVKLNFELFINQKCRVTILKLLCSNEEIRW